MNPSAIYSKSGKGVQEAAGKTSHLARPDRAVLAAIDGRATLAEVAQKVGKTFDAAFEKLVGELDKGGFVREVSPGTPAAAGAKPGAGAPKPAAKVADPASDLDFTSVMQVRPGKVPPPQSPPKPAAPPPKPSVAIPPAPPPPSATEKAKAEQAAKAQQDAFTKAREEAERKAAAERDRIKAEAEAKVRAETEAKMRQQAKEDADRKFAEQIAAKAAAEKKAVADAAEAKIKAEREAAARAVAEAKAKADAEAKKVREEAERARKEAEEKARREQEELRRKLEEERKAREEAERKAKEEARRLEEERRKLEEERRQREEEKRREEEERAARRKREEEEEKARAERRRREEEEEARARAERKKREEEEEAREQAEREARRKAQAQEEEKAKEVEFSLPDLNLPPVAKAPEPVKAAPPPPPAPAGGGGFSDSLLADLDSFSTRDDQEQKEREEQLRKDKEAAAQRAREAEERRQHELIEQMQREEKERKKQEERERKAKDEAELKEREEKEKERLKEEEEKRAKEAEERAKKAKQEESLAASSQRGAQFDLEQRKKREAALQARVPVRTKGEARATKGGWGKPVAITLFLLLVIAFGVAHVMPIDTSEYERGATEALGQPVKIGSANLSLIGGDLQLKFHDVSFGDTRIAELRGFPEFDSLLGPKKVFTRIEIHGAKVPQEVLGPALFAKVRSDNFSVARVLGKNLELVGPLAMPKGLELDASYGADGMVRTAFLRGPEALVVKLEPKGSSIEVDMSAATFTLPFAPEVSFGRFSARGRMNSRGFNIAEWDAAALNGTLSGTATITWDETWTVEGVVTARNINAAVFAPALLSDGRGEGSAKFSMRGSQPAKLGETARIDGTFTVSRGVLGSFDLARAVQSQGKVATGRTQFSEMTGNAVYDRGTVALRNVTIGAGQLNAGASADIAQNGALSGRIVADMRVATQQVRATLQIGGTVREPQVRN